MGKFICFRGLPFFWRKFKGTFPKLKKSGYERLVSSRMKGCSALTRRVSIHEETSSKPLRWALFVPDWPVPVGCALSAARKVPVSGLRGFFGQRFGIFTTRQSRRQHLGNGGPAARSRRTGLSDIAVVSVVGRSLRRSPAFAGSADTHNHRHAVAGTVRNWFATSSSRYNRH